MRKVVLILATTIALAGCSGGNDASQQAEIERLRAETEKLRAEAEQLRQQNAERQAQWEAQRSEEAIHEQSRRVMRGEVQASPGF